MAPLPPHPPDPRQRVQKPLQAGPGHLGFPSPAVGPFLAGPGLWKTAAMQPEPSLRGQPARAGGQEGGGAAVLPLGTLGTEERGLGYSLGSAWAWSVGAPTACLPPPPRGGREGAETLWRKETGLMVLAKGPLPVLLLVCPVEPETGKLVSGQRFGGWLGPGVNSLRAGVRRADQDVSRRGQGEERGFCQRRARGKD